MYIDRNFIYFNELKSSFKKYTLKKHIVIYIAQMPAILFVVALTLITTLPKAMSHGLGGDGQFYAVVARNLSDGIGSFWMPSFSSTLLSTFYEHPPLGLGIQSIFFRLFGDSFLVEKLYSVGTLLIVQFFMSLIWFRVFKNNERLKSLFWLPLLFLIFVPTVTHAIGNNVLENTMGVFTIIAMYSMLRSIDNGVNYFWMFVGALMMVLAVLTKGPVGCFLLAFYPIYMFSTKLINTRITIQSSLIVVISFSALFALLLINDHARNNLFHYFNGQLMGALKDGRGMAVNSHFYIVWELLKDLMPIIFFMVVMYLFKRKNIKYNYDRDVIKYAVMFLLIGLSASIPSMISLKQNVTYIVACYPLFAIGFAVLATMMFDGKIDLKRGISKSGKVVSILSFLGIISIITFSVMNTDRVTKQENYYYDAKLFSNYLKDETVVGLCSTPAFPWDIHSFFERYYRIGLDLNNPFKNKYFLGTSSCTPSSQNQYKLVSPETGYLKLYELIK